MMRFSLLRLLYVITLIGVSLSVLALLDAPDMAALVAIWRLEDPIAAAETFVGGLTTFVLVVFAGLFGLAAIMFGLSELWNMTALKEPPKTACFFDKDNLSWMDWL